MSSTLIQPFNIDASKTFEFAGVSTTGNVTVGASTVQTVTDFTFAYFQDLSPSYAAVFTTGGAAIQAVQTGDTVTLNFNTGAPITVVLTFTFYNEGTGEILWTWDTTPPSGTTLTSVELLTAGSGNLLVTGSSSLGNVSIATAGARITGDFTNATVANRVAFQTSTANSNTALVSIPNGTGGFSGFQFFNNADPDNSSYLQVGAGSTTTSLVSGAFGTGSYLPMTFFTAGVERMRIDSAGYLLVGTTSAPSYTSTMRLSGGLEIHGAQQHNIIPGNSNPYEFVNRSAGGFDFYPTGSILGARINSSGNFLLGTTSDAGARFSVVGGGLPSTTGLHMSYGLAGGNGRLVSGASTLARINSYLDTSTVEVSAGTTSGFASGMVFTGASATNPSLVRFYTASAERACIDANGRLGINTSSPLEPLDVNGDTLMRGIQFIVQAAPTVVTGSTTLSAAQLFVGIIQCTTTATITLPSYAAVTALMPNVNGSAFDFYVISTGGTATIAPGAGMDPAVGNATVSSGTDRAAVFRLRWDTSGSKMQFYRIA